ncbi:MAG: hypothetical protein PT977_08505 [Acidobacteriota bacterium]|nr:hypothetical protein [Acidobacteriota bacterium]
MKGEWVTAERAEEVRAAARGWRRAGAVSEGTFEEISRRYPEPRALPAPLWRVVTFVLASAVLLLATAALFVAASPRLSNAWILCAFAGAAFVLMAEIQARSPAMALRGGVEAAGFWGIVFLVAGLFLLFQENLRISEPTGPNLVLAGAALLFALAAWRWGSPAWAFLAALSLFLLLGRAPAGRLLWIACGVALTFFFERFLDRPSWAPSHRRCAAVLVVAGLLGVYAALNLYALDHRFVEFLRERARDLPGPRFGERIWSTLGTAILPVAVVWWGVRSRRTFVLDTGLVLSALSLMTLRFYVHLAPIWVVLCVSGGILFLLALALNRWLARGSEGERYGFTAEPLFADEARLRALGYSLTA